VVFEKNLDVINYKIYNIPSKFSLLFRHFEKTKNGQVY